MDFNKLHSPVSESVRPVKSLLSINQTVNEAVEQIRKAHSVDRSVVYFYVVDEAGRLLGVVGTRELLISPPETPLSLLINTKVRTIQGYRTMHEALILMQKFHLLALPVVQNGKFMGILDIQNYFEESIQLGTAKKRAEIFQTMGFMLEEGAHQSTWQKYYSRAPWIFCNMFGGIACAIISGFYEIVLVKVIVLAMFIPLVLSLSESISMQSMTQSIHEINKHPHFWKQSLRYILHESKLFTLIALTCGIIIGLLSLLWGDGWGPAITIGSSIGISILVTAIVGALVPIVLHSFRLDPKIASGPVVLMCADIITTLIYLSLAFWWLIRI